MPYKDPVKAKAYRAEWWERNRESQILRLRERYQNNKQYYRDRTKKWYDDNPERASELRFQARKRSPWKYMLKAASERATLKNVPFSLTKEWALEHWTGLCAVTGLPFDLTKRGYGPGTRSPSIDRIDPVLGYIPENCRFVLHAVNGLKHSGTEEEMYKVALAIVNSPVLSKYRQD